MKDQLVHYIKGQFVIDENASTEGALQVPIIFDVKGTPRPFLEFEYRMGDKSISVPKGWYSYCPDTRQLIESELTGDMIWVKAPPPYRTGSCYMLASNAYEEALARQQRLHWDDNLGRSEVTGEIAFAMQTIYYGEVKFPNLDILPELKKFLDLYSGHRLDEDIYHLSVTIPNRVGDPGEDSATWLFEQGQPMRDFSQMNDVIAGATNALVFCDPSSPVHERDRGGLTVLKTIFYGKTAELTTQQIDELQLLHDCLTTLHPEMKWTAIGGERYGQGWHTRIIKDQWYAATIDGIRPESIFGACPHARQVWYWSVCLNSEFEGYSTLSACGQNLEAGHDPFMNYLQRPDGDGFTFYLPDDVDNRLDYKTVYASGYPQLYQEQETEGYDPWYDSQSEPVDDNFRHYCLHSLPLAKDINQYQMPLSAEEMKDVIDPDYDSDVQALIWPEHSRYDVSAFHFPPKLVERFSQLRTLCQQVKKGVEIVAKAKSGAGCPAQWTRKLYDIRGKLMNLKQDFYHKFKPMLDLWLEKEGYNQDNPQARKKMWDIGQQYWRCYRRIVHGRPDKDVADPDITYKKIFNDQGKLVAVPYQAVTTLSAATSGINNYSDANKSLPLSNEEEKLIVQYFALLQRLKAA